MNKSIKKLLITVSAVGALLFPVLTPAFAGAAVAGPVANIASGICGGANLSITPEACAPSSSTDNTLENTIKLIVNLLTLFVGFLSVVFLIFGAFKYISSGGDSGKVTSAKSTILYALIGLAIAVVAQVIVQLVIGKANQTITA